MITKMELETLHVWGGATHVKMVGQEEGIGSGLADIHPVSCILFGFHPHTIIFSAFLKDLYMSFWLCSLVLSQMNDLLPRRVTLTSHHMKLVKQFKRRSNPSINQEAIPPTVALLLFPLPLTFSYLTSRTRNYSTQIYKQCFLQMKSSPTWLKTRNQNHVNHFQELLLLYLTSRYVSIRVMKKKPQNG